MRLLLVCGPWGSGTTAVAGLLERLGAIGFGPYFHTNDPHTGNAYELIPFRDLIRRFVSEATLALPDGGAGEVEAALRWFRGRIESQALGPYDVASGLPIFFSSSTAFSHLATTIVATAFPIRFVGVKPSDIRR